jgi:chromosome segregation ATPase
VAGVVAALQLAAPAHGADLDALERALREAWRERGRLVEERTRKVGEAAVLADEIARQKAGGGSVRRADRRLEDALKRFDKLAVGLDEIDRRIAGQDRGISALRRKFDDAAGTEAARLSGHARSGRLMQVAHDLDAIDQARRRVASLGAGAPAAFRPPLDVSVSSDDGVVEMQQKGLLLESERERVLKGIAGVDAEANVLAARILVKRRLSAELDTAARTAGSELALLRREADNATEALHDLDAQREALVRQKAELSAALARLDQRLEELRTALRSLGVLKGESR